MPRLAIVFSGQGSQYAGMGKQLYKQFNIVQQIYAEASDTLGYDLAELSFNSDDLKLSNTEWAQPALFTLGYSMFQVFREEFGVEPHYLAGHSLGEYTALACSDALSFTDALKIVSFRGRIMQTAVPEGYGGMASVSGVPLRKLAAWCESTWTTHHKGLEIACYNSPNQLVISGEKSLLQHVESLIYQTGGKVTPLKVSAPFHCHLMNSTAAELQRELKKYHFQPLSRPVVSNVTAKPYGSNHDIVPNLTKQMIKTVRWYESILFLQAQGIEHFLELGPGQVLGQLITRGFPHLRTLTMDDLPMLAADHKNEIRAPEVYTAIVNACLAAAVSTESRHLAKDDHQRMLTSYQELTSLKGRILNGQTTHFKEEAAQAIALLQTILHAKQADKSEIQQWLTPVHQLHAQL